MKYVIHYLMAGTVLALFTATQAHADGAETYNTRCMACHSTGAAGAPKLGDKDAWAVRIATGMDTMIASATIGKGAMPPKGGCADCSDADIAAAVEYMVSQSQ